CYPIPTCVDLDPCATVRCAVGYSCVAHEDGTAGCEPGPFCGGIAGFPCPGAGTCVDDPIDDCHPDQGGADCGGLCSCQVLGSCIEGYLWDSSPEVCGCVPTGEVPGCAAV